MMKIISIILLVILFSGVIGINESFARECNIGHILILKSSNNNPACVTPTTAERLVERGWGMMPTELSANYTNSCQVEYDPELCKTAIIKYYFNAKTLSCEQFIWGGCGGLVPFDSLSECQIQCKSTKVSTPISLSNATNVIDANNQFAINFYSQVSQESDENIFFSPWSISTVFAMVFEGAKENTSDEIRQVFGFPVDYQKRTSEFRSAMNNINSDDPKYQLSVANALWLAEGFEPFTEYVDTAINFYDGDVNTVDFISDDGVNKINAWVEEKTQGKINDILKPSSTNELTRLAITNAIYFKGSWATQFNENNTSTDTFWNGEQTSEIPLMHLEHTLFNYTQTDQFQILKMPYEGDKLSMLVLLPNENDGLTYLEKSLSIENLNLWQEQLTTKQVEVFMPKFKLETTYNLKTSLIEMGMPTPFSERHADFGGIAPNSLYISQAIHKAFVDVNEEGTEAAAATVIVVTAESYRPPPPVFRADHPFVFLIQDDSTKNILFIGRMMNPSE